MGIGYLYGFGNLIIYKAAKYCEVLYYDKITFSFRVAFLETTLVWVHFKETLLIAASRSLFEHSINYFNNKNTSYFMFIAYERSAFDQ